MSIQEFKAKYGTMGFQLLIEALVMKAPEFEGDTERAKLLGEICADLQSALEELE